MGPGPRDALEPVLHGLQQPVSGQRSALRETTSHLSFNLFKLAVVGQVGWAPGLLLVRDPHHDELGAVIISVNLYLKYCKWGIKSMRNSTFKRKMDFVFA